MLKIKVKIKKDWEDAGKIGEYLGQSVYVNGQYWQSVLWDDEEDPNWVKSAAIDIIVPDELKIL